MVSNTKAYTISLSRLPLCNELQWEEGLKGITWSQEELSVPAESEASASGEGCGSAEGGSVE